jgi:hypothetical protein
LIEAQALGPVDILVANRAYVGMLMSMALFEDWLMTEVRRRPSRDEIVVLDHRPDTPVVARPYEAAPRRP